MIRYVNKSGDPLELESYDQGTSRRREVGPGGFRLRCVFGWMTHQRHIVIPMRSANIYASLFTPRVKHTADILISLHDGYYYGWSPFGRIVRLAATHGNALQSSSNAFLMSTHRNVTTLSFAPTTRKVVAERIKPLVISISTRQDSDNDKWITAIPPRRGRNFFTGQAVWRFVAVDHVNLRVNRGSFFGFLGPNGAGKSTTIKMLTGLLAPTSGTLRVLDLDISQQPMEVKRRIGVVPEDLNLFERLTGPEMLSFTGRMYGLHKEDITQRSKELLELMELQDEPKKTDHRILTRDEEESFHLHVR